MEIILIVLLVLAFPEIFIGLLGLAVILVRWAVLAAVFVGIPLACIAAVTQ